MQRKTAVEALSMLIEGLEENGPKIVSRVSASSSISRAYIEGYTDGIKASIDLANRLKAILEKHK